MKSRNIALEMLESDEYAESLRRRIKNDTLPEEVECLLIQNAYSRPARAALREVGARKSALPFIPQRE